MMKLKKRLLTDAFLAVATIGMAAGMVWADDGGVSCPEKEVKGIIVPAFKCPTGMVCVYLEAYGVDGELVAVAGGCLVEEQPIPE